MPFPFNVFSRGVHALIDPTEGNDVAENAAALVGQTCGKSGNLRYQNVQRFSPGSAPDNGVSGVSDQNNSVSNENFRIDGGGNQTSDGVATDDATLTYANGSTASIIAVVFQDTSSNTYLAPEVSSNSDQTALGAGPTESIRLTSIASDRSAGLDDSPIVADCFSPEGSVDDPLCTDTISAGFSDTSGDTVNGSGAETVIGWGGAGDRGKVKTGEDIFTAGVGNEACDAVTDCDRTLVAKETDIRCSYVAPPDTPSAWKGLLWRH